MATVSNYLACEKDNSAEANNLCLAVVGMSLGIFIYSGGICSHCVLA